MKDISPRQADVLRAIMAIAVSGRPVTLGALRDALGVRSNKGFDSHLAGLDRKGYIRREPCVAGGIVVLRDVDGRAVRLAYVEAEG